MASATLDVLRHHTGERDGPDVLDALRRAPLSSVDELAGRLLAVPPVPRAAVPDTEVWPLVNARASLLSRGAQGFVDGVGPAGLNLSAAMDPRELGRGTFSSGVVRALLYSHGLVVEDPLLLAAELHTDSPAHTRGMSRQFIQAAATALFEIDALLDAGIVETFFVTIDERSEKSPTEAQLAAALASSDIDELWDAFEEGYVEGLAPSLRALWARVRAGDRTPPSSLVTDALTETDVEVVRVFIDVVASLRPRSVIDNTFSIVLSALDDFDRFGRRHDLLCASELFARLLFIGAVDPVAELRVRQLATTSVPNIEQLDIRDVVAIRQGSEAFSTWRSRLSMGLERAHRLRDELGPEVDLAAAIDEVLADAREQLGQEARRSRIWGQAGWVSFVAGALGGATAGSVGGLPALLSGAGGGGLGALAQRALDRSRPSESLRRHYVLFRRQRSRDAGS
jgi:hypothetical protein